MKASILIAGAGPVGLTHAIELRRLGHQVRIIDKNAVPSPYSKAIAINPKSLTYLQASGATEHLLQAGVKVPSMQIHAPNGELLVKIQLNQLRHAYPFMLAVPQNVTEQVLTQVLTGYGTQIERGKELISLRQADSKVIAEINTPTGPETIEADYLVGADGAHSTVRKTLGIEFAGHAYSDQWSLADVSLDWPVSFDEGNLFLLKEGNLVLIFKIAERRYRVISNHPNVLTNLPANATVKHIYWQSDFKVSCRQVSRYQEGRVFLMGDAAHIHSPAGGQGMNLGMEDACILAKLIHNGQTHQYAQSRHSIGKKVIRFTSRLFTIATLKSPLLCAIRNLFLKHIAGKAFAQKKIIQSLAGLR